MRLPAVYGQGDYRFRFKNIIKALEEGVTEFPCNDNASWKWTHAHVDNVAHAVILAAEKSIKGFEIFNVGEKSTPTMKQRVEKLAEHSNRQVKWKNTTDVPKHFSLLGKMPNDFVADSSKIRNHLGYNEIRDEEFCYKDLINWSLWPES